MLNTIERYKDARKNLTEAVGFYRVAVGNRHGPCGEADDEMLRVIDFLLTENKGAAIAAKCEDGGTPLSWAAENGHEAVVKLLLEKGAAVDTADGDGRTPLSWAAENGHETVVKLLLEKGAAVDTVDGDGRTPLS